MYTLLVRVRLGPGWSSGLPNLEGRENGKISEVKTGPARRE